MGTLILSISGLIGIFILNIVVGLFLGFGKRHYWFFELEHFLGGFFVAMFFANFTDSTRLILLGVAVVSAVWESAEYLVAKIPRVSEYLKMASHQRSVMPEWKDTVLDIILNFAGAFVFFWVMGNFLAG